MPSLRGSIAIVVLLSLAWSLQADAQPALKRNEDQEARRDFFHEAIEPILIGRCLECHGEARKGDLDLRSGASATAGGESGSAIEPGSPDDSLLYEHVSSEAMPPDKPLSQPEVAAIRKWIADGAYFPAQPLHPFARTTTSRAGFDWWSLQPLQEVDPPATTDAPLAWKAGAVDRFIYAKLAEKGLQPSPPADPRTLIRRATFDLTGLPPTPKEVQAFLLACRQETGAPNKVGNRAYAELIGHLLQSERYGEQWGRHWLDVVRFGESNGFERNVIHNSVWPFRDYVIRSFNEDKPFDRFIAEHLAGDVLAPEDPQVAVGTAFLVCGPYDNVGNQDAAAAARIRANTIDEMIRATGEAFLGLTVGCARCHDHKFDPISQQDYYGLYATLAGVRHGERTLLSQPSRQHQQQIALIERSIEKIEDRLRRFQRPAFVGRTIILDDEMPQTPGGDSPTTASVTRLEPQRGHGTNPAGTARGFRDDPGDVDRTPNISQRRYHWWDNRLGVDFFAWNPAAAGRFRVWLSWGCGWPTHTENARYVLDVDGNLGTQDDQELIATVDQRHFAGGGPDKLPKLALWSGFLDAGVHEFGETSRIVLRGGSRGQAVTADVIVLQEEPASTSDDAGPPQPRLRPAVHAKRNVEPIEPVKARYLRFAVQATNSLEPCIDELEAYSVERDDSRARNVALAAAGAKAKSSGDYAGNPKHKLAHVNDGRYGNSFSWISNQKGGGWVQIEFAEEQTIDRIVWGRDREEKYTDRLARSYEIAVATKPDAWKVVATSSDRLPFEGAKNWPAASPAFTLAQQQAKQARPLLQQLETLRAKADKLRAETKPLKWWVGTFQQVNGPFHVFLGGSPQRRGKQVQPAGMETLRHSLPVYQLPANSPEKDRRLALAQWIARDDNPLTLRVLTNRIWHYHFGRGIVGTPSDFGFMGGRPSHPELLDWLASELRENGWRLKPLHREIMLSQTYRQASSFREQAAEIDADTRLLWRFPPRRLEAEEIRDTALAIAGKLDCRMGGPGFRLFKYVQDNVATYHPLDKHGPQTYRRAVYHHRARAMQIDLLTEFDAPDCAFSAPRRSSTTTPLQALTLMNHSFTLDMAEALAERIVQDVGGSDRQKCVSRAFELAFNRPPDGTERKAASSLVDSHGLRALCRALLNANEFIYLN